MLVERYQTGDDAVKPIRLTEVYQYIAHRILHSCLNRRLQVHDSLNLLHVLIGFLRGLFLNGLPCINVLYDIDNLCEPSSYHNKSDTGFGAIDEVLSATFLHDYFVFGCKSTLFLVNEQKIWRISFE